MVIPSDTIKKDEKLFTKSRETATAPTPFIGAQTLALPQEFEELNEEMLELFSDILNETKTETDPFNVFEKDEEEPAQSSVCAQAPIPLAASVPAITPFATGPTSSIEKVAFSASVTLQVGELFDKMVGTMSIMDQSGITETRIQLNSSEFSASRFYGSEILIQEFSTAPKSYNIQFVSTSSAVELFQAHASVLLSTLKEGNFGFTVNRLEAFILSEEKHLVSRKENVSEDKQEQGEDSK